MPKKNEKKKKSIPLVKMAGMKKKKKTVQSRRCDGWTRVTHTFNPGGNEGKDKKKMKVGHFGKFFSKGVKLEIFFANRVRKKNSIYYFNNYCNSRNFH